MKNKLNNKGFAVSTVVYAILILLVIFMFTILLLYRNTYRNQKDFNDEVKSELNDYLIDEFTPPDTNAPNCVLEAKDNLDGSYTLILSSNSTDLHFTEGYYLEGKGYLKVDELSIKITQSDCGSTSCTYKARTKDSAGNETECDTTVTFDNNAPICTLSYDGSNLVITSTDNDLADKPYSFDGTNYDSISTKTISTEGNFTAYVKDKYGNVGECSLALEKLTATFNLDNRYQSRITFPTSVISKSCLSSNTSCNITTPNLTVSSSSSYTYTAKGWSTTQNASSASASKNAIQLISSDVTYYPVISRTSSGGGGSSSSGCNVGVRTCSYSDGVCTSCVTGDSNGICISCKCPC